MSSSQEAIVVEWSCLAAVKDESLKAWLVSNVSEAEAEVLAKSGYTTWERLVDGFKGVTRGTTWLEAVDKEAYGLLHAFRDEFPGWSMASSKMLLLKICEKRTVTPKSQATLNQTKVGSSSGNTL